jgi:tetratricopeptide (TPR) repeat protein
MTLGLLCAALVGLVPNPAAGLGNPVAGLAAEAREHYQQGQYPEALRLYREALLQDPKSARLHFNAGDALFKMQNYEGATKEYAAALQGGDPALRAQGMYNMGNAHFQQQRFDQAVEAYQQALELESGDPDAKANLELALRRLEEQQQDRQQRGGKQQDRPQNGQDQQQQDQAKSPQEQQQNERDQQRQQDRQQDQGDRQEQTQGQRMSKEEAERVLQALRDRELQGKLRRAPMPASRPDKDW